MAQQKIIGQLRGDTVGADVAVVLRRATIRMVGALLALAVATAHVADRNHSAVSKNRWYVGVSGDRVA